MPDPQLSKASFSPAPSPAELRQGETWARHLLAWYDKHARELPWRVSPKDVAAGVRPDPYRVWLSEIMLQQTNVTTVRPYFEKFLARWPNVGALAATGSEDVMRAWAGLGYYSRARNLKACADAVAARPGGFPSTATELRTLPGVGEYTAAAIAAIAFGEPSVVIDGNVERVATRLGAIATALPQAKPAIRRLIEAALPRDRPGDFAQATMDLGATICTPKRPQCLICPVRDQCLARRDGNPEAYPVRPPKLAKPQRCGAAFVAFRDGRILLRTRPDTGLLAAMSEVPTSAWSVRADGDPTVAAAPFPADWRAVGRVGHVFTHFSLDLVVFAADADGVETASGGRWVDIPKIFDEALPTVMKRVVEAALRHRSTQRRKGQND